MDDFSHIQKYYQHKTVFITGGNGFMGKVLIEKLLHSCTEVRKIFILLRSKRNKSAENRLSSMLQLPVRKKLFVKTHNE